MLSRALLPLFLGVFASTTFAKEAPLKAGLVDLHGEQVVLVEETLSADGRYAAGWTVHPKKGKPPVKWAAYGKEDNFIENYCDNENYLLTNVLVDLTRGAVAITLNFTEPYFGGKNHGGLEAVFGPERDGHRFAIALSDSKWEPNDVVLVDLSASGATQCDLRKPLDAAVLKTVHAQGGKKGGNAQGYVTEYILFHLPEIGLLTGFADAGTVRVPFNSCVPKAEEYPAYMGTVLFHLTAGKDRPVAQLGEVHLSHGDPDPAQDNPQVAAADKELNAAYTALRTKLDAAGKTKLQEEQRTWIKDRDSQVAALPSLDTSNDLPLANTRLAADRLLLRLTRERAAALRAR